VRSGRLPSAVVRPQGKDDNPVESTSSADMCCACRIIESVYLINLSFHCLGDLLLLLPGKGTVSRLPTPDLTLLALLDVPLLLPGVVGSLAAATLFGLDKSRRRSRMRCVRGNSREN
jgi:hypothetical protein